MLSIYFQPETNADEERDEGQDAPADDVEVQEASDDQPHDVQPDENAHEELMDVEEPTLAEDHVDVDDEQSVVTFVY